MQTGQAVSAKMLPSPGICLRDRINAELLGEASAVPGCSQGILPRQRGVPWGKLFATLKPKSPCADGSQQNSSKSRRE